MEINIIPKFLDEAVTPLAQRAGNTLSSIWTIAFGGIDIYAEKTQIKRVHALNQFKEELEQAVSSIPEENIIEPPLHIVGPSLEASKYYFENANLRTMFANLISASMNADTISQTHPSFVEIIKQLSPLDAVNLQLFKSNPQWPIAQYKYITIDERASLIYQTNVFLENKENSDIDLNATSISNLNRLGLLSVDYNGYLQGEMLYEKYNNIDAIQEEKDLINYYRSISDTTTQEPLPHGMVRRSYFKDIILEKGIVGVTPLGKSFINLCI
ncbi:DUF4393 domain-containing protein [Bacillus cereus]|uniref:DUF4393 domain-containing protein n=1 Tax=Bacillus cereus TaxID=1396 RepID=UPI000BF656DF|nr:DUF4393 domain-containing protein [Bacillus cereus]MDF9496316.1 DUF4393 domain-containing protein [Bacillus cereus]PEV79785.1 hypothetical protein CN437_10485 [Bacillus cereus]PGU24440.1 hypothetical protein COD65_22195 [Bacillus cereus]